eukprot:11163558-Lingulodinium_polyedra.AAC.1
MVAPGFSGCAVWPDISPDGRPRRPLQTRLEVRDGQARKQQTWGILAPFAAENAQTGPHCGA